jgi:hypothetical protein
MPLTFTTPRPSTTLASAVLAVGAIGAAGCAAQAAQTPAPAPPAPAPTHAATAAAPVKAKTKMKAKTTMKSKTKMKAKATTPRRRTAIDRMVSTAEQRWSQEQSGLAVHQLLHRIAADPGLRAAVRSGRAPAIQAAVNARFRSLWYHWHASRVRVLRGGRVLADAGVGFVVAPSSLSLRNAGGRTVATLEVSEQDVVGFVRYMNRNHHIDVVARGVGAGHVRSSLPAALHVNLPARGTVTIGGRRYQVREFARSALNNEKVRIWILMRG